MLDDEDPKIEYSPLCGTVTRDGVSIELKIYRLADEPNGWTLELVDGKDASTVWDNEFPTDRDAYAAFNQALEAEGITGVLDPKPNRLN